MAMLNNQRVAGKLTVQAWFQQQFWVEIHLLPTHGKVYVSVGSWGLNHLGVKLEDAQQ